MASQHDGKHARQNMWVTHQNLARAKGGRPHYQPKPRKPPVSTAAKGAPAEPKPATSAPASDGATKPSDDSAE